jgi:hypothetical protein
MITWRYWWREATAAFLEGCNRECGVVLEGNKHIKSEGVFGTTLIFSPNSKHFVLSYPESNQKIIETLVVPVPNGRNLGFF